VGAKRNARRRRWPTEIALPLVVILLISALLQSRSLRQLLAEARGSVGHSVIPSWTGVMLCLLGVGLAIHARWHLGRNQGMPMSRKEQPELVTKGPYALIRHPIDTGLILARFGSAMGVTVFWALLGALVGAYFIYSARRKETGPLLASNPAWYLGRRRGVVVTIGKSRCILDRVRQESVNPNSGRSRASIAVVECRRGALNCGTPCRFPPSRIPVDCYRLPRVGSRCAPTLTHHAPTPTSSGSGIRYHSHPWSANTSSSSTSTSNSV
jgi:protein-S-isoprenylcysteine O-methyltransferase Ste14